MRRRRRRWWAWWWGWYIWCLLRMWGCKFFYFFRTRRWGWNILCTFRMWGMQVFLCFQDDEKVGMQVFKDEEEVQMERLANVRIEEEEEGNHLRRNLYRTV
jgi:hypothetical protein